MKKKFIYILFGIFFIFPGRFCNADDNFYVQSLSIGDEQESNSSISYSNKELQNYNKTNDNANINNQITTNNYYYYPSNPYYYPYYSTYTIRPYYSRGISIGGYNYTGFAYNYGSGKKIITTAPQRITIPNTVMPANPSGTSPNQTPSVPNNTQGQK